MREHNNTNQLHFSGTLLSTAGACELGPGSIVSILAMICYFLVAVTVCCTPRPEPCLLKDRKKKEQQEEDAEMGAPPEEPAAAAPAAAAEPIQAQTH